MGREPWGTSICWEIDLQVDGQIIHPSFEGWIQLNKVWIDAPLLSLLDLCIHVIHPPDVTNNTCEPSEIPCDGEFRVVNSSAGHTQVKCFHINGEIRPALWRANHQLTNEDGLPYSSLSDAISKIRTAGSTCLVVFVVLVKTQILGHLDTCYHSHPRTIVVSTFGCGFSCFEYD